MCYEPKINPNFGDEFLVLKMESNQATLVEDKVDLIEFLTHIIILRHLVPIFYSPKIAEYQETVDYCSVALDKDTRDREFYIGNFFYSYFLLALIRKTKYK